MKTILAIAVASLMVGCASKDRTNLPAIPSACIFIEHLGSGPEPAYVNRRTKRWLIDEGGFVDDDQRCGVNATYTGFDVANWELLQRRLFSQKASAVWRIEGVLTIKSKDGATVLSDDPIAIDGHATKQAMLDDLAWQIAERIIARYRSTEVKSKK